MITVYNSRDPRMSLRRCTGLIGSTAVLLLSSLPVLAAVNWAGPARTLAQQILAVTGPGAISLEVTNRSSLGPAEVNQARNSLVLELERVGIRVLQNAQAAAVHVTFSENVHSYLWVAEVRQGASNERAVMTSFAGSPGASFSTTSALSIQRTLLLSSNDPILDAAVLAGSSPEQLVVLDSEKVKLYVSNNGQWVPQQIFPILHAQPWPRDLRGHIALNKEHLFDVYLPGLVCQAALVFPLSMPCHEADDPWPLSTAPFAVRAFFAQTRNFFTGIVVPQIAGRTALGPFYSAAPLPGEKYTLWVVAAVDGSKHLLDGINDVVVQASWGSDIAAVKSWCGPAWYVLATAGRNEKGDSLRAYQVVDREPSPVTAPLEFNGAITALWSKEDGSAIAVEHNEDTGKYEAFSLAVDCHN